MAFMREAEVCAEGEASSGGYSGVGEVSSRGGAEGSCKEELGIWKTEEDENSGKDRTCRERTHRRRSHFVSGRADNSPGSIGATLCNTFSVRHGL